jgi:hypothetical protein
MQVNVLEESASGTHCGVGKELVLWNTLIPNHKWTTRSYIVVQYQSQGDGVEWAMWAPYLELLNAAFPFRSERDVTEQDLQFSEVQS